MTCNLCGGHVFASQSRRMALSVRDYMGDGACAIADVLVCPACRAALARAWLALSQSGSGGLTDLDAVGDLASRLEQHVKEGRAIYG